MSEPIAIIVAMEREIVPLLQRWRRQGKRVETFASGDRQNPGCTIRCGNVNVYCAGIGREAARRTVESVMGTPRPKLVISAGLAGALTRDLNVADTVRPAMVVDAATGQSFPTRDPNGRGVLVSVGSVLSGEGKAAAAQQYQAQAIDMEAAAVAQVAEAAGVSFMAVKAISDPLDFEMPPLDRFISPDGKLNLLHLLGWASLRPRTWRALASLGRNSRKAATELARELERVLAKCDED